MSNTQSSIILKHGMLDIPQDEPFENDLLYRKELGENLKKFVLGCIGSLTISVNGAWGTGKTTFLKMWEQSLKNDRYSTIYFSAWEDDHCNNALLALMGQIWKNIKDNDWQEMRATLKEVFVPFLKNVGSQVFVNATGINPKDFESQVEKMLDQYNKETSDLRATKERLATVSQKCQEKTGKPLVIIIDELDRCRPLFAIELLEKIKHFFELPGIIFVLGIDREQLGHSIRSVYGNIDVDGYLRRFIDLEFLLQTNNVDAFCKGLFEKFVMNNNMWTRDKIEWIILMSKCFGLSLREMEYLVRTIIIGSIVNPNLEIQIACAIDDVTLEFQFLLPLLIVLKLRDEPFYKKIITGECNATEIIEQLVKKHNAWELFGIDSGTKKYTFQKSNRQLCDILHVISSDKWREAARNAIKNCTDTNSLPVELFHPITKKIYFSERTPKDILQSSKNAAFGPYGYPINDLAKCIEMVDNSNEPRWQ